MDKSCKNTSYAYIASYDYFEKQYQIIVLFGFAVSLYSFLKNWQVKSCCIISKAIRSASMYLSVKNCKICNTIFAPALPSAWTVWFISFSSEMRLRPWSISWITQSNTVLWILVFLFLQLSQYILIFRFFFFLFYQPLSLYSDIWRWLIFVTPAWSTVPFT